MAENSDVEFLEKFLEAVKTKYHYDAAVKKILSLMMESVKRGSEEDFESYVELLATFLLKEKDYKLLRDLFYIMQLPHIDEYMNKFKAKVERYKNDKDGLYQQLMDIYKDTMIEEIREAVGEDLLRVLETNNGNKEDNLIK